MALDRIFAKFQSEVNHFIASALVDTATGKAVISTTVDPGFDPAVASPVYAEVVRSNARALSLLGIDPASTEDLLISTTIAYLLIRMLPTGHHHGLAVTKQANLGLSRILMKKYEAAFVDELRALGR